MKLRCAALAALVLLGSCAGGGEVTEAADTAKQQGSVRREMTSDTTAGKGRISIRIDGTFDLRGDRGRATMRIDLGSLVPGRPASTCEVVYEGQTIFVGVPEDKRGAFEGKAWIRSEVTGFGGQGAQDPSALIEQLEGASELERTGSAEVRGVDTTRYRGRLEVSELVKRAPPEKRDEVKEALRSQGVEHVPLQAWIDAEGLPRRMRTELETESGTQRQSTVTTLELFDYGRRVDIDVPAAADAFEQPESAQAFNACLPL